MNKNSNKMELRLTLCEVAKQKSSLERNINECASRINRKYLEINELRELVTCYEKQLQTLKQRSLKLAKQGSLK